MNEEYLWQKTGEDPEIARLEKALSVYRYRETDPPAPPVTIVHENGRRWRFRIAFATAAFASMVVAALVWFQVANRSDDDVTFIYHPPIESTGQQPVDTKDPATQLEPETQLEPQPVRPEKQPVRRGRPEVQTASLVAPAPKRHVARTHPPKAGTAALTKEERYAYQQLMLALSISSSKFNIVRDTINGVEEPESAPKQNNR